MAYVSRDTFWNITLHKERIYNPHPFGCHHCGGLLRTPSGKVYLFRYWNEPIPNPGAWQLPANNAPGSPLYCSVGCMRAY